MAEKLINALNENKYEQADWLLRHGENPNEVLHGQSVSPMHLAAGLGIEPVCLLLQHGGDPNIKLADGTTPLHVASMWGDADCVQILLSNGGDPYIRDQDGLSAMDFARKYKHWEVVEVIKKYMFLLMTSDDVTLTPKYTYTRRSVESDNLNNVSSRDVRNGDIRDAMKLEQCLNEFARRRRSSVYINSVQRQMNKYFSEGRKTHVVDVTSPDHPYVEPKYCERSPSPEETSPDVNKTEESLHLHLSISDNEESTCTSEASFVTCDGEDLDTIIKMSATEVSIKDNPASCPMTTPKTVKKQPNAMESSTSHRQGRQKKYCRRLPVLPSDTQDLYIDESYRTCDYCGLEVKHTAVDNVCISCERLGLELEELTLNSNREINNVDKSHNVSRPQQIINAKKKATDNYKVYNDENKQCRKNIDKNNFPRKAFQYENSSNKYHLTKSETVKSQSFPDSGGDRGQQDTVQDLDQCFIQSGLSDDSIITNDESFVNHRIEKAEFHPSDISTITISDLSSQDYAFIQSQSDDKSNTYSDNLTIRNKDQGDRNSSTTVGSSKHQINDNQNAKVNTVNKGDYVIDKEKGWSPELDELWSEVRASAMKAKKARDTRKMLDTAFIGRESMTSTVSDASTVDYVYTDKEHGIVLLERHLPSQCGSTGSRRSLDSLFSLENSPKGPHNLSNSSQDTISYDWKEHAMIKAANDSGNGESLPNSEPLSQELLKLSEQEIRGKLCQYWEDPGPVTPATKQAYLRRLSQLQKDPSATWLTQKGPEYPPELSQALRGKLDLSDCSAVEAKMVEAFQNPNRLRRWREGTLKSSFNYVLLDPRITDNLPNRAINMDDLDIFRTFISAIFYVGKGKRARPYCHLYEAIKHMKKPNGKASRKVQQIIDIWSNDMGVVSLHCFQSVIPVEAYTREACMVDALGLKNLTNMKRGDYYGVSTTYSMKQRRRVGVYLLTKALQIFLAEGERQISPLDIKNDP